MEFTEYLAHHSDGTKERYDEFENAKGVLKRELTGGHPDFIDITLEELELHNAKNRDYTQGGDPLGNFNRVSELKRVHSNMDWSSPVGVCIGYALKQYDAAMHMLSEGYEGEVEGVDKRLEDVHVYMKIARILARER